MDYKENTMNTEQVKDIPAIARNQKFSFKAQKIPNRDLEHNSIMLPW